MYFYLSRSGELRQLAYNHHTTLGIGSLFGGEIEWLLENFGKYTAQGKTFDESRTAFWLMRKCEKVGHFDPQTVVRGPGVWRDQDNRVLVHCGDKIGVDGAWIPAGIVKNDVLYPASPRIARPPEGKDFNDLVSDVA